MPDLSIAISTAATAIFAGITLLILIRQFSFSKPNIHASDNGGDSLKPYRMLLVKLLPPDDKKYFIQRISLKSPKSASICRGSSSIADEDAWVRSIELEPGRNFENLRFKNQESCIVKLTVVLVLSSNVSVKRKCAVICKMSN